MKKLQTDLAALYQQHVSQFKKYSEVLVKWNSKINLTTITDPDQIEELHFFDSLAIIGWLRETENVSRETFSVLDIGAGAGFPGLPMKVVEPEIKLTLIDSTKKKCDFMKEIVRSLSLQNVQVIHDRVDSQRSFDRFDCVVSRAAFKLKDLMLYARPNLKPGGLLIAMKSIEISEELHEAEMQKSKLNYSDFELFQYSLPRSRQGRQLVILKCFT